MAAASLRYGSELPESVVNLTAVTRTLSITNSRRLTSVTRMSTRASAPSRHARVLRMGSTTNSLSEPSFER